MGKRREKLIHIISKINDIEKFEGRHGLQTQTPFLKSHWQEKSFSDEMNPEQWKKERHDEMRNQSNRRHEDYFHFVKEYYRNKFWKSQNEPSSRKM